MKYSSRAIEDAASAVGEDDKVLRKDGSAVGFARSPADGLPSTNDAALEIFGGRHTRSLVLQNGDGHDTGSHWM